ncbi:unnamed protein product [Adineta steineri]|uniref:F-box domain-containing protein n=1 Tax=Adineta steineri TaxID=433720 RepID=A0A820EMT5_9BILA|nr:unnamed protein product [Adineta steineri]
MDVTNTKSTTWFDPFPTEITFLIFDYLSNNDIIYTFFFLSERITDLLLENKRYITYLKLPTTNVKTWENILSIISARIESLNINSIDMTFSLTCFSNLKSLIISCPYGFPDEELKLIFASEQFESLHSFRILETESRLCI